MFDQMFHLPIPLLEKILRPIIVYLALILLLRVFGKRELAQLNPFDLVVLLSLSNTVQNALIGEDNSISGGLIGAFTLLAIIHRQGYDDFDEVEECSIGPNGQFYVRGRQPSQEDERHAALMKRLDE